MGWNNEIRLVMRVCICTHTCNRVYTCTWNVFLPIAPFIGPLRLLLLALHHFIYVREINTHSIKVQSQTRKGWRGIELASLPRAGGVTCEEVTDVS
jgi:hypothetical protein